MCGIIGILNRTSIEDHHIASCRKGLKLLQHRGPDFQSIYQNDTILLGHSRLSILDTSPNGNQPMKDIDDNLVITYNGEFYNYKEERLILEQKGYTFKSQSDTEVLIYMYKAYGHEFVKRINGCFAIALFDIKNNSLFLARDRFGIKPLYYKKTESQFTFASEITALMAFESDLTLNKEALHQYFRFNYIPSENTALEGLVKMKPGYSYLISGNQIEEHCFYTIPYSKKYRSISYDMAQKKLFKLTEEAVQKRMISDVPLGTFLSGGVDSSIISTLASQQKNNLNTFSIGYQDEPLFDETKYAELVAKQIGSQHHTFRLTNRDLYEHLFDFLDALDEPFADSSALPVYILSKKTSQYVKVSLSGDGADEIFSGYNKHLAHYKAIHRGTQEAIIQHIGAVISWLPQGRNSKWSNIFRQIDKFHKGLKLSDKQRYLSWLSINSSTYASDLTKNTITNKEIETYEKELSQNINNDFNDILYSDMRILLPNDMLTKVDKMSMAHSLEVRTPFLDHNIVDFAFSLPSNFKINHRIKKRILQDTFKTTLPPSLYNRAKHGFEVPLLNWFKTELKTYIFDELLQEEKIKKQNILNFELIRNLKSKLFSAYPSDAVASIWAILVFQYWYDKHFQS